MLESPDVEALEAELQGHLDARPSSSSTVPSLPRPNGRGRRMPVGRSASSPGRVSARLGTHRSRVDVDRPQPRASTRSTRSDPAVLGSSPAAARPGLSRPFALVDDQGPRRHREDRGERERDRREAVRERDDATTITTTSTDDRQHDRRPQSAFAAGSCHHAGPNRASTARQPAVWRSTSAADRRGDIRASCGTASSARPVRSARDGRTARGRRHLRPLFGAIAQQRRHEVVPAPAPARDVPRDVPMRG